MDSIVKNNLMKIEGYSPYCGNMIPRPPVGKGCDNPRTRFNGSQFICPACTWKSDFSKEFILEYKTKWKK